MSAAHTPGPWRADQAGRYWKIRSAHNGGAYVICECAPIEGVTAANARLIRSAPQLVAALLLARPCLLDDYPADQAAAAAVDAALAAAGVTP